MKLNVNLLHTPFKFVQMFSTVWNCTLTDSYTCCCLQGNTRCHQGICKWWCSVSWTSEYATQCTGSYVKGSVYTSNDGCYSVRKAMFLKLLFLMYSFRLSKLSQLLFKPLNLKRYWQNSNQMENTGSIKMGRAFILFMIPEE